MTITMTDWIEDLRRAGVRSVTLELHSSYGEILPPDQLRGTHHTDPAPRTAQVVANAQAESDAAPASEADDAEEPPQERDLDLAHLP